MLHAVACEIFGEHEPVRQQVVTESGKVDAFETTIGLRRVIRNA